MSENFNTENCTEKQFEKWFWEDLNTICLSCKNDCKQSSKVKLTCAKFLKMENLNETELE